MEDLFKDCNTDSEVMRRVLSLAAEAKLSRSEINALAAKRRQEIQEGFSKVKLVKLPKGTNTMQVSKTIPAELGPNSLTSNTFQFYSNGRGVKF